jgi:cob(I)alamin adenosyltransferase
MANKSAEFYTRKGDEGYTGIIGDQNVLKSDSRIEALGAIDEANAALGMARSLSESGEVKQLLLRIQRELYSMMAEVAESLEHRGKHPTVSEEMVGWLELQVDHYSETVEIPKAFIIPGDSTSSVAFDQARTIVRRAERRVVKLYEIGMIKNKEILKYLNRLSSLCYVLELNDLKVNGTDIPTLAKEK